MNIYRPDLDCLGTHILWRNLLTVNPPYSGYTDPIFIPSTLAKACKCHIPVYSEFFTVLITSSLKHMIESYY